MNRWIFFAVLGVAILISCDKNPGSTQSGDLEGLVTDKIASTPVEGAVVSLENLTDTTGPDGKYLFPGISKGEHLLKAKAGGYLEFSDSVKVGNGYNYFPVGLNPIPVNPYGTLSGKVQEKGSDNPIPGVIVEIGDKKDSTDQSGNYKIDSLTTGSFIVTANAEGYASYSHDMTINSGDNSLDISLEVKNDNVGSLSGIVYESGSGHPIAQAIVEIDNKKDTTGQDGKFLFDQIDTGSYIISVSAVNYDQTNQPITIVKGQNNFNVILVAIGNISGTVTEEGTNKKLAGVEVQINDKTSMTDQNGIYKLPSVPIGTYNLTAKLDLYNDYSKSVSIKKGDNKLDISLTPKQLYTNIYGNVTNGSGGPVQGALIELAGNQQLTPATGFYQFPTVPQGSYNITVTKDGYDDYKKNILLNSPDYRYDIQMTMKMIAPPAITNIEKNGSDNITLNWNPLSNTNLSGYNIYNTTDTTKALNSLPVDASSSSYQVTGALPGIYSLRMSSINKEDVTGVMSDPSDSVFVYQKMIGDDFESRRLDPTIWIDNKFDYTIISDSKYVIDGNYSLMYMGGKENIFKSTTIIPGITQYTSVAKVRMLSPNSRFSMEITNSQSTGTRPIVWIESDSNGDVSIGYKDNASASLYPYKSYGSYSGQIFKVGLFVDTSTKKFSILVNDKAIYTTSYTRDNLDTLSMYFENRQIIDDIVIGSFQ